MLTGAKRDLRFKHEVTKLVTVSTECVQRLYPSYMRIGILSSQKKLKSEATLRGVKKEKHKELWILYAKSSAISGNVISDTSAEIRSAVMVQIQNGYQITWEHAATRHGNVLTVLGTFTWRITQATRYIFIGWWTMTERLDAGVSSLILKINNVSHLWF